MHVHHAAALADAGDQSKLPNTVLVPIALRPDAAQLGRVPSEVCHDRRLWLFAARTDTQA